MPLSGSRPRRHHSISRHQARQEMDDRRDAQPRPYENDNARTQGRIWVYRPARKWSTSSVRSCALTRRVRPFSGTRRH